MFQREEKRQWPRIERGDKESDGHWLHRIRVSGFYRNKNSLTGERLWMSHWGKRPPDDDSLYVTPKDEGEVTNGAGRSAAS